MPSNREIARGVRVEIEHALASDDPPAWVDLVEQTVMTALDAKDQERDRLRAALEEIVAIEGHYTEILPTGMVYHGGVAIQDMHHCAEIARAALQGEAPPITPEGDEREGCETCGFCTCPLQDLGTWALVERCSGTCWHYFKLDPRTARSLGCKLGGECPSCTPTEAERAQAAEEPKGEA